MTGWMEIQIHKRSRIDRFVPVIRKTAGQRDGGRATAESANG
jgi:hypothetical protein